MRQEGNSSAYMHAFGSDVFDLSLQITTTLEIHIAKGKPNYKMKLSKSYLCRGKKIRNFLNIQNSIQFSSHSNLSTMRRVEE